MDDLKGGTLNITAIIIEAFLAGTDPTHPATGESFMIMINVFVRAPIWLWHYGYVAKWFGAINHRSTTANYSLV
nr:Uncharacterised protein [Salmonella sp. NCTC 7297]